MRTNQDTGLLRLIACLCMAIDHVGKMLFPELTWMRLIGRLAFPLFAYGIAVGAACTKNPLRYLSRVAALALISQPLYAVALAHETPLMYSVSFIRHPLRAAYTFYVNSWQKPSILFSLFLGLALLLCLRERRFVLAAFLYILCERFSSSLDYGINGIRLMALFYMFLEHPALGLAALSAFTLAWARDGWGYTFLGMSVGMRIYALPAVIACMLPVRRRTQLPKGLTYAFYPAHLAVLAVLVRLF